LVRERGRVMKEAGALEPGGMAAVLGMQADALRAICDEVGDVWVANDNSPGQIVVSGKKPALATALRLAQERGARRSIPLAVTIASHSPLMRPAAESFAATVNSVALRPAIVPVVANVTAQPLAEPADIRAEMLLQLTSSVRWVDSVRYMIAQGVRTFVEMGPKNTLSRLINQIDPTVQALAVGTVAELDSLKV
jgi:[acyl-carrier-protein] S-malonyltransferase